MGSDSAYGEPFFDGPADEIATLRKKLAAFEAARNAEPLSSPHFSAVHSLIEEMQQIIAKLASAEKARGETEERVLTSLLRGRAETKEALASERAAREKAEWERDEYRVAWRDAVEKPCPYCHTRRSDFRCGDQGFGEEDFDVAHRNQDGKPCDERVLRVAAESRAARAEAALLSLAKVGEDDDGQPVLRISCGFHCETADTTELPLVWAVLAEIGGKR